MKTITLANGVKMPVLGFGTFQITDPLEVENAVATAITCGYRHIDTAQSYLNEVGVGRGIKKSGVPREEIFVTTKIWVENVSYEGVKKSFVESLARLDLTYVDLVLIHQPYNDIYGAWRALEELFEAGKIRGLGVSNFTVDRVVDLNIFNEIPVQVNQIEINPFHQRQGSLEQLKQEGVVPTAWAPFAEGKNDIFNQPILVELAQKHQKSVAQIIIRWLVEQEVVVLAKTVKPERMKENLAVFDFSLTTEDKVKIAGLEAGESQFFSHADPEMIRSLAGRKLTY